MFQQSVPNFRPKNVRNEIKSVHIFNLRKFCKYCMPFAALGHWSAYVRHLQ